MAALPIVRATGAGRLVRTLSLLINLLMLGLMVIALTNEDGVAPQGRPVVATVLACVLASVLIWWRARLGGWLTLVGAAGLAAAVIASSRVSGLGWPGTAVAVLIYPIPYVLLAGLALADVGRQAPAP